MIRGDNLKNFKGQKKKKIPKKENQTDILQIFKMFLIQ